jgi:hypothetical protein
VGLLGHGFFGEYYSRHVPSEDVSCPCGFWLQTRGHLLADCPLFEQHRHHLRKASASCDENIILGTAKGRAALMLFLRDSDAFKKSAVS